MKVLGKLTVKHLKLNTKRTIVTIIGIMLATALMTAVVTMAISFQQSLVSYQKKETGDFHYAFLEQDEEMLEKIKANRNIESYYEVIGIGYANLEGGTNEDKPYIFVEAMDENAMEHSSVQLEEGRMPENDSELLISKTIFTNGGVEWNVGDTVTLSVGERLYQGEDIEGFWKTGQLLNQRVSYMDGETIEPLFEKTYTIVGITKRLSYQEEDYSAPGYTVITYMEQGREEELDNIYEGIDIYTRFSKEGIEDQFHVLADLVGIDHKLVDRVLNGEVLVSDLLEMSLDKEEIERIQKIAGTIRPNSYLLAYEYMEGDDDTIRVLYTIIGIVLAIIVVTSAFCISNSFGISITEKTKQYGMLASIGATPKQIRRNVYYEAAILGGIGIPFGVLLGLLACMILVQVLSVLIRQISEVSILFATSWQVIVIAVLFSIVMIFLSAIRPAIRASRVSPIVALRGNKDIKLTAKTIRTPKWIAALFGISGKIAYKNRKRNKKKYRVVVISIMVSVTVFITMFSFTQLLGDMVSVEYVDCGYSIRVNLDELTKEDLENFAAIEDREDVNALTISQETSLEFDKEERPAYTKQAEGIMRNAGYTEEEIENLITYMNVVILPEQTFSEYAKSIGAKGFANGKQAVLVNDGKTNTGDKMVVYQIYDCQPGDSLEGYYYDYGEDGEDEKRHVSVTIGAVTDVHPMGYEGVYYEGGTLVVSDQWTKQYPDLEIYGSEVYIDCEDADALQKDLTTQYGYDSIYNVEEQRTAERTMLWIMNIFLYGFICVIILISVTNIFNTVTTSMEVRRQEFAALQSVGMTPKQFRYMVRMESFFYGIKALALGIVAGSVLSYILYDQLGAIIEMGYHYPWKGVLIAVGAVALLLGGIMQYSLGQIRKQNIIETLRQDNV